MSVCESWSSLKDIRVWAAIDDETVRWTMSPCYPHCSLLMSKRRLRQLKEIQLPVRNCALSTLWCSHDVRFGPGRRGSSFSCREFRIRVKDQGGSHRIRTQFEGESFVDSGSIFRQVREELNLLRSRYRSVEGEDPMKSEEVTDANCQHWVH